MRALFLVLLTAVATGVVAQTDLGLDAPRLTEAPAGEPLAGAELDRRTEEVASTVRCPVCQGLSVADSPMESALAIKRELRDLLEVGYSEEQVLGYLEGSYGEFIRLEPKAEGFNLVVWLAPILALLAGLGLVLRRTRASKVTAEPVAADEAPELSSYLDQVREETRA